MTTQLRLSQILNTEQYTENEAEQSTISTSFVDATSLTFNSSGTSYLIFASLEGLSTADKQFLEVRLIIDGVVEANNVVLSDKEIDLWFPFTTFKLVGLLKGQRNISLQFRSVSGSEVKVRRCRIFIMDMS